MTAATRHVLVHGDVSPKNILVGPNGPVLLDAAKRGPSAGELLVIDRTFTREPLALAGRPLIWPFSNPRFLLGTDNSGRDIAAQIFYGARISLLIGGVATGTVLATAAPGALVARVVAIVRQPVDRMYSAMLQYIMCVSRFAHFIKVIGRDRDIPVCRIACAGECVFWTRLGRIGVAGNPRGVLLWRDEPTVVRSGATAIVADTLADQFDIPMSAGTAVLNGAGELTGSISIDEWGTLETPILRRSDLATPQSGPLIVEEYDATCVIPPGAKASLDAFTALIGDVRAGRQIKG